MVIGMVAVFVGCVIELQESETEREGDARVQSEFTARPLIQRNALFKQREPEESKPTESKP